MDVNRITEVIIGSAIEVHKALGPGLLESAYEPCLAYEIGSAGLGVERQVPLPVYYRGVQLDCSYRMDLVVEGLVVVEVKAVSAIDPVHVAQGLTYLKLSKLPICLIINFNVKVLVSGLRRLILAPPGSLRAL
jgi:GxxExxY protein